VLALLAGGAQGGFDALASQRSRQVINGNQ
jgi:hypothetical protein